MTDFRLSIANVTFRLDVWVTRITLFFLLQGAGLLLAYSILGFDTDKNSFPPGLRLDPIHASVHLFWGVLGTWIGFFHQRSALAYLFAFASFYIGLAVLGTFVPAAYHCGMRLEQGENIFHWLVGPTVLAVALYCSRATEKGG
jgi:hypothetical protein